ncbi:MAG: hypothetical protein LUG13_07395 [Oscillospiraceae bacterium]|nr:hypothetical protein [Oscillospiraceae bacterium]
MLGIIGIILAFAFLLLLTFKNVSTIILATVAVVIVALFNQLPIVTAVTDTYVGGIASLVAMLFMLILLGTILGQIYTQSGASTAIANTFIKAFVNRATGERKIRVACAVIIIIACLFQFGGIDSFVVMFTTFPIIVTMFKQLNMPRKYIPGMLMCSVGVGASPGAPTVHNILPMSLLGTTSTAGALPGVIAFLIIEVGAWLMISTLIIRAMRRGEGFSYGEMKRIPDFNAEDGHKQPNFVVALLPLILVFVLFTIFGLNISIALAAGIVLALILMGKNIFLKEMANQPKSHHIIATLNNGAIMSTKAVIEISVIGGLAAVVASTTAFQDLASGLVSLPIHPLLIVLIAVFILVAITSSPPAGLAIIIPIFVAAFVDNTGVLGITVSAAAIHRICSVACLTFETLPFNGMVVIGLDLAKVKHREGYFSMFMASVFFPVVAAIVAAVMLIIAPGLA